jgi:hypothetical protein
LCEKLITATDENLGGYKGKMVKVSDGNVMGTMDAFTKVELIK